MKMHTCFARGRLTLASLVLVGNFYLAQSAPAENATSTRRTSDDETVQLSPFVVQTDKDTGYIAADTLSAGRLATNLLTTPGDFDVMTRDLINDLGVFNIDEASGWLTNSRPIEQGAVEGNSMNPGSLGLLDSGVNVNLRGLGANPSTRNYFLTANTPKEYNVERVESARGPNAILYGEGGPGGGVNYITKRAQSRNFATLRFRSDSLWSKGVSIDINRKLNDQLDVRYNGSALDQRYYVSRTRFKSTGNALNVIYRPFERTTVSVDADVSVNSRPGLVMQYGDAYTLWDKVPVTTKLTAAQATAAGLALWSPVTKVYIEGLGLQNYGGMAYSRGVGLLTWMEYEHPDLFPGIQAPPDRGFNANPSQVAIQDHTKDFQASIDHTFLNGLSVQVAGQYSKYQVKGGNYYFTAELMDPNKFLADGTTPNPHFGDLFSWSYAGRQVHAWRDSKAVRAVAVYPLRILGTTTNISAFIQHQEQGADTIYTDQALVNAPDFGVLDPTQPGAKPITDGSRRITVYRYWNNLPDAMPDFSKLYEMREVPTVDAMTKQRQDAFEVAATGKYWHDRLSFVAGFRRDKSYLLTSNGVAASRDPITGAYTSYSTDDRTGFNNTLTVGVVFFPIKYAGVYANHGEGFTIQTIANPRLDGTFAKANIVPAFDNSFGLRFNIASRDAIRIVGSAGYYYASQSNSAFAIGVGGANVLWRDLGMEDRYIRTFNPDPVSTQGSNAITSQRSLVGWGYEASLTANFGKSFRLTVNGALPHTKQSDVGADYTAYINANLATWQALDTPSNPNRALDVSYISGARNLVLNFQEGRQQNNTYKYRYNVFGVYTFTRSALKGFRIGGGAQVFGPWIIGNQLTNAFDYIYSKTYTLGAGYLGYNFKAGQTTWDLQLNVDNLFGYDKQIVNGLFNRTGTLVPYGSKVVWPRTFRLTTTISF